jgi:methyl-accepting chemotaxis protein
MITLLRQSIIARILAASSACMVLAMGLLAGISYVRESSSIQSSHLNRLEAIAMTLAPRIDGDAHRALEVATAAKDDRRGGEADYEALRAPIAEAVSALGLDTPAYTLVLDPAKADAIRADPAQARDSGLHFMATSHPEAYFRHSYEYRPEVGMALFDGKTVRLPPYRSSNGTWISVVTPVRDAQGAIVAAFEIDEQLDEVYAALNRRFAGMLAVIVVIIGASILALWWLTKRISRPISELAQAAEAFGAGDYNSPIPGAGPDEVGRLASTLEHARSEISGFIDRILDSYPGLLLTVDRNLQIQSQISAAVISHFGSVSEKTSVTSSSPRTAVSRTWPPWPSEVKPTSPLATSWAWRRVK